MLLALTILLATSNHATAADEPQLTLGDKLSVFSDKAYRKNNGRYFEAVGNVVIISQKDTVYGELASLDQETMMVKIEGNVRFITKDMTLYGSHVEYNLTTGAALIKNARILTNNFNLVATELARISEDEYLATDAEFTTCKDCAESWSVFGKVIRVHVGKYVQIRHGLAKIKGINVLYIPYIVLPILTKRKSGLLIPRVSSRTGEGLSFEQPVFWAINEHKDMTFGPTFWAERGYGGDLQYRQRFKDLSWVEFNGRGLNDTIYEPGKKNQGPSGETFFRYFTELETHQQLSSNLGSHFRYTGTRDLDIVRDHQQLTENKTIGSDFGLLGNVNWRKDYFSAGAEVNFLRNQLTPEPLKFDRSYVQTLPRVTLSSIPYTVWQSKTPGIQNLTLGVDSSLTRFRQVKDNDAIVIRNADRLSTQPYLMWHFFTWGPVSLKSRYMFDRQVYDFEDSKEAQAGKSAGLIKTEVSFTLDKIFGLAYEERVPLKSISEADLKRLRERKEQGLTPLQKAEKSNRLVGDIPPFESELARDNIIQVRNGYRHSQEYKLVHHFISSENEYGNKKFLAQIDNQNGLFDFEDARRSEENLFGANTTRTIIPPENTLELQWNNSLIKKSPKTFSYLEDDKYLRDNFTYTKIGYFNVSQGYLLNRPEGDDFRDRLTRLMVETGYTASRWSLALQEYYFHDLQENIFTTSLNRRFDYLNIFGAYNYNSFAESDLQTLSFGGQIRPTDTLGLALVKDMDLAAKQDVRTVYSVDIMPHNNCWILNLNFRESLGVSRYSFNVMFNFGDEGFERYRTDYFAVKRL